MKNASRAMSAHFQLRGKTALVTGSARGLGHAIALGLAGAGADLAVMDLPKAQSEANTLVQQIESLGRSARFYPFDVTVTEEIPAAIQQVVDDFGGLDVLVNNAGISDAGDALSCTSEEWDAVLGVNLKAMFFFSQAAARHMMRNEGGKIINLGSPQGLIASGNAPAYKSSKGGVHSLTRELAFEWIKYGINVNAIIPGPTATPAMLQFDAARGLSEEQVTRDVRARVPLGRRMHLDEIAAPVVFLASPAGNGLVGHLLVVDGGRTIF